MFNKEYALSFNVNLLILLLSRLSQILKKKSHEVIGIEISPTNLTRQGCLSRQLKGKLGNFKALSECSLFPQQKMCTIKAKGLDISERQVREGKSEEWGVHKQKMWK